jgi:hypothetical protein
VVGVSKLCSNDIVSWLACYLNGFSKSKREIAHTALMQDLVKVDISNDSLAKLILI